MHQWDTIDNRVWVLTHRPSIRLEADTTHQSKVIKHTVNYIQLQPSMPHNRGRHSHQASSLPSRLYQETRQHRRLSEEGQVYTPSSAPLILKYRIATLAIMLPPLAIHILAMPSR